MTFRKANFSYNLFRIFFLSFLILGFFIFENEISAENQIRYNMDGEAASFESENNSAKVRITMDNVFLQPHLEKPEQFTISLESDDKLSITSFKYGDAIGGTSEIVEQFVDIVLIKTYSDLENTKSFTNVQNLSITTDTLLINPLQDVTASIYSDTVSVSSSHDIAFPEATKFSFGIPKGSTEYYIVFSDDAEIIIDGVQYTPADGWKDKAVILTLDSIGLRSLSTAGNFFIESQWKDLKIDSQAKFDFIFYDIKGEIAIDEPKVLPLALERADDVVLRDVRGEVTIKKLENTFQIYSRGVANTIEHNEKNILDEDWIQLLSNSTILQLIVTIIIPIGAIIFAFFKWILPRLKKQKSEKSEDKKETYQKIHTELKDGLDSLDGTLNRKTIQYEIKGKKVNYKHIYMNQKVFEGLVNSGDFNNIDHELQQPLQDIYGKIDIHDEYVKKIAEVENTHPSKEEYALILNGYEKELLKDLPSMMKKLKKYF